MKLPTCASCQHSFTYGEAMRYQFSRRKCPACKQKQFITKSSFVTAGIPSALIVFVLLPIIQIFWGPSFMEYFLVVIGLFVFLTLFLPFLYVFSEKQEPIP
ncbi:CXXC-20-CXXC protein [Alkalihalobacillus xiaoxiensis]|uniref:CXXC-20-CXXC protein n=1 Tax=Shouchella xiaoxiensis TaxID=766895 RepID=A0ABS2SPR7_9BACI|nr:TIGR04104 family putative zinc finger protein [Shouchella xiaoxiensis]MBM7836805.1 CXXC-20-CXXC protein [Shouchella xiaoxiensis]